MKKKWMAAVVCGVLFVSGLSVAYAADLFPEPSDGEHKSLTEIIEKDSAERKTQKDTQLGINVEAAPRAKAVNPYEAATLKAANEEQKEAIAQIKAATPLYGERAVKIVLGELPADQPRITEEQAKNIISKIAAAKTGATTEEKTSQLLKEFNEIHGAPDYVGGSGIYRTVYILSEAPGISITFLEGTVTLRKPDPNSPDKSIDIDLLKNEVLAPGPSASPK